MNAVRPIVIDFIEKLMNYIDSGGFLGCLGQGAGTSCGGLWRCGIGVLPLIISFALRIEAWKLLSSRPGLMSWLGLIRIGMIERWEWHLTRSTL